jgi:hypothetical protein
MEQYTKKYTCVCKQSFWLPSTHTPWKNVLCLSHGKEIFFSSKVLARVPKSIIALLAWCTSDIRLQEVEPISTTDIHTAAHVGELRASTHLLNDDEVSHLDAGALHLYRACKATGLSSFQFGMSLQRPQQRMPHQVHTPPPAASPASPRKGSPAAVMTAKPSSSLDGAKGVTHAVKKECLSQQWQKPF